MPTLIGSSGSALGGPFIGRLLDKRGPRLVTAVGTALVGISCFVLAVNNSILFYIAFYSLLRMTGQGMVQLSNQITAAKWFERRRGRAIALITLITSVGLVAAPPVAQALIDGPGIRVAWMAFGILALGLGTVPSLLLLVRSPEDMGLQPDGAPRSYAPPQRQSFTAGQAIHTPALWAHRLLRIRDLCGDDRRRLPPALLLRRAWYRPVHRRICREQFRVRVLLRRRHLGPP